MGDAIIKCNLLTTLEKGVWPLSRHRGLIVLLLDAVVFATCNFLLFLPYLRGGNIKLLNLVLHMGLLSACVFVFQLLLHTYETLWRYAESLEYLQLFKGLSFGFLLYAAINLLAGMSYVWISGALTGTSIALLIMLAYRFTYRVYRRRVVGTQGHPTTRTPTAIIGAGAAAAALLSDLDEQTQGRYRPYCLVDDDPAKQHKRIHGVPVYGPIDDVAEILRDTPVTDIILAIRVLTPERRKKILELCSETHCRIHMLGEPLTAVPKRSGSYLPAVREVEIDDLLGRSPVRLDNPHIAEFLHGKTVLVTGGGGSIGSELCRQIAGYRPARLVLLDIAENTTYELQNDLLHRYGHDFPLSIEIASVRDRERLDQIFEKYRPQVVFHAAAHKHVPLMEACPCEAVKNNVLGTYNTASAASRCGAEKFVLISTDKAVNPTNVMGATKYLCEQVLQGLRHGSKTEFAAVRFGNVLGSSGSVIPLFKKQIAYGGPVTITDRRIVRYFMTIAEAVQLVLEAGSFARSGEVFVLDMGQPVYIRELAEKMICLSGLTPGVDIEIQEIGLRPGEKLYEELLISDKNLHRTENAKIFVEQRPEVGRNSMKEKLDRLRAAAESNDAERMVALLHEICPTFRTPEEVNREAEAAMQGAGV